MSLKYKTLQEKLSENYYGVKIAVNEIEIKTDVEKRIVKFIGNTYFFIDEDQDMLIPGCCAKSIADRGVNSNATAKIKHQSDHVLNTKNVVGRLTVLDERVIDGLNVLYCESYIPETSKGNDDLMNYREGIYDNHSIGFRYKNIVLAERDSVNELSRQAWNEYYPLALNPIKADEAGYFWVVKEIELFEISVVSYGANSLTPNLTGKSKESNNKLKQELFERIDELSRQLKPNAEKEERKTIDLEVLQLKQIITELELVEPLKTDTLEPSDTDTKHNEVQPKSNLLLTISKKY